MEDVNWDYLSKAIDFYKTKGYTYIEVPWMVPMSTIMITCPHEDLAFQLTGANSDGLVGSAEQSFMHLSLTGELPKGKYVTCSPCFRKEPTVDFWHQTQFMKVELFDTLTEVIDADAQTMVIVDQAFEFFETLGVPKNNGTHNYFQLYDISTVIGIDIELMGVEIGSYGVRSHGALTWIYGTGIAEPRFSSARRTLIIERLRN